MNYKEEQTILCLENLEIGYGEGSSYKPILKNINLTERDVVIDGKTTGQIIAIVGRSGRGKSTLFKALTGLLKPKEGRILIQDLESEEQGDAKLVEEGDVGFVDQKYTLFRHKTIEQIMKYALRNGKFSESVGGMDNDRIIKDYLETWGLTDHKDKYPIELSGGQRQRTAIIEQILSAKHFMILDEPFSGLDVGNIRDVKRSFDMILKDHELNTIIFSTHDLKLAAELADSVYVIGFPENNKEYCTIVKHFDLKKLGLAWQKFDQRHLDLVEEIDKVMINS